MEFLDDPPRQAAANGYGVAHVDDVPYVDLAADDEVHPEVGIRPVDEVLGLERMGAKLWYFDEGDDVGYHAHPEQEELYYVLEGKFSLKLGPADDPEYVEVGPGTFFAARAMAPHGYRCIEGPGVVLAVGAPKADQEVLDPYEM